MKPSTDSRGHLSTAALATIVALVVLLMGAITWLAITLLSDDAAVEPEASPTPIPTDSPSPTPTPSASPSAEPWQVVDAADLAVLERLRNPTTGEVWHDPIVLEDQGLFDWEVVYAKVGTRGDADIVVAVDGYLDHHSWGHRVIALFELEGDQARMIQCPSARATDLCAYPWSEDWLRSGRSFDTTTHYDSLTYPSVVYPEPGLSINTDARGADEAGADSLSLYGHASWWDIFDSSELHDFFVLHEPTTVLELGDSRLVASSAPGPSEQVTLLKYSIVTPFGTAIATPWWLTTNPDYGEGTVTWNDGRDTFTHTEDTWDGPVTRVYEVVPAANTCIPADEAIVAELPVTWVPAGTTATGREVLIPTAADDPLTNAIFAYMRNEHWDMDIDGTPFAYRFSSAAELIDARGLFAWERHDGTWALAMDEYALNSVWECA